MRFVIAMPIERSGSYDRSKFHGFTSASLHMCGPNVSINTIYLLNSSRGGSSEPDVLFMYLNRIWITKSVGQHRNKLDQVSIQRNKNL